MDNSKEKLKIAVIDYLKLINDISITRGRNITYPISDKDRKCIKSFKVAISKKQKTKNNSNSCDFLKSL